MSVERGKTPLAVGNYLLPNFTGEATGLRIYKFNGSIMKLFALETLNSGTWGPRAVGLSPNGNYVNITVGGTPHVEKAKFTVPTTLLTYQIEPATLKLLQANVTPSASYVADFSADSKWVIVTGGDKEEDTLVPIAVFKVNCD